MRNQNNKAHNTSNKVLSAFSALLVVIAIGCGLGGAPLPASSEKTPIDLQKTKTISPNTPNWAEAPEPKDTYTYQLSEGWGWHSFPVMEPGISAREFFGPVLEDLDQIYCADDEEAQNGIGNRTVDELGTLEPDRVYILHMAHSRELTIEGDTLPSNLPLELKAGENWIGYHNPVSRPAADVFEELVAQELLTTVMGYEGALTNSPWGWIDNLGNLEYAKGYQVTLTGPARLFLQEGETAPEE